jgi:hypothetical protein
MSAAGTTAPSSQATLAVQLTPSRKGKEVANGHGNSIANGHGNGTPARQIHSGEIDLSWPNNLASVTRAAAGMHNPSMACYANATVQVLMHTPPVLRMAFAHEAESCACSLLHERMTLMSR